MQMNKIILSNNDFVDFLTESAIRYLISEASEQSLHQYYDKYYDANLISKLLAIDTTTKKKFAEWVLKVILKELGEDYETINFMLANYIKNGSLNTLFDAYNNGVFQPMSYKNIDVAINALEENNEIQTQKNIQLTPVYNDGTIMIYLPKSYIQLQNLLRTEFGKKVPEESHWCVVSSEASDYWSDYTKEGKFDIFLIYNSSQKKLYLWNNNPYRGRYTRYPDTFNFNDWNDDVVSPTRVAMLTQGAIKFLNDVSNEPYKFTKTIERINDGTYKTITEEDSEIEKEMLKPLLDEALEKIKNGASYNEVFDEVHWDFDKWGFIEVELNGRKNIIFKDGSFLLNDKYIWFDGIYLSENNEWFTVMEGDPEGDNARYNIVHLDHTLLSQEKWFEYFFETNINTIHYATTDDGKYNFVDKHGYFLYNAPLSDWFDMSIFNDEYAENDQPPYDTENIWGDDEDGYKYMTRVLINGKLYWLDALGNFYDYEDPDEMVRQSNNKTVIEYLKRKNFKY